MAWAGATGQCGTAGALSTGTHRAPSWQAGAAAGGGWYGGGGGSSGVPGAGGGGGGSSYGGPGGPVTVTTAASSQQPSVVISWVASTSEATSTTTTTTTARSPRAVIASSLASASKGYVRVELSCERAACWGSAELTQQMLSKEQKSPNATDYETVVLAKGPFRIAPGRRAVIRLKETTVGAAVFAGANDAHRVRRHLVVTVRDGVGVTGILAIS